METYFQWLAFIMSSVLKTRNYSWTVNFVESGCTLRTYNNIRDERYSVLSYISCILEQKTSEKNQPVLDVLNNVINIAYSGF